MEPTVVSWIAGIVEGEGYIGLRKQKYPCVVVEMSDEDTIHRLHGRSGIGRVFGPYERPGKKTTWRWEVSNAQDAVGLLAALAPWLSRRRAERAAEVTAAHAAAGCRGRGWRKAA